MPLRSGDKGSRVRTLQHALNRAGAVPQLSVDGDFGPITLQAVRRFQLAAGLEDDGVVGKKTWALLDGAEQANQARRRTTLPAESGIKHCGAWAGSWALSHPQRAVDLAVRCRMTRLDVIVNDHCAWRRPRLFTVRNPERILRLAATAIAHGLDVHLMSWAMPHKEYLGGLCSTLGELAQDAFASSIQLDLEEPWVDAVQPMNYLDAAEMVDEGLFKAGWLGLWGINAIPYTGVDEVGPMIEASDYALVQSYATSTSGVRPHRVDDVAGRWRRVFPGIKKLCVGLAAYRQSGISGHTKTSALETSYREVSRMVDVDTVVYWQLRSFLDDTLAGTLANLRAGA